MKAGAGEPTVAPGPNVGAVFLTLAGAIAVLVTTMWLLRWLVYEAVPAPRYSLLGVLAFAPTLAIGLWRGPIPRWVLFTNFALYILAVTIGIHFGGGVDNVSGPLLYALLIGLAGLIGSGRAAYGAALGCTALYGLLVWAERQGWLEHHLPYSKSGDDAVATVFAVGIYLFLVAWIVSHTVAQIHAVHHRLDDLRAEAVSALSHDLKNPLGAIASSAELAAAAAPNEVGDHLERIQRGVQTALGLVNNVVDAAALQQDMLQPRLAPLDPGRLLGDVVDLYRPAARAKGIGLTLALAADLPPVDGDAHLLARALGNLLSNAIKFTPVGGVIAVGAEAPTGPMSPMGPMGRILSIEVRDSGRGIAAADRAHLFEKFNRGAASAGPAGSGLGLYIVRAIVEAHRGRVLVGEAQPTGAVFTIELPAGRGNQSLR